MNLLDRMAYDTGGYTVQEILSSFCKKILEIIDLVNKNEEVCDEVRTIIENIRNEVVPDLVDDIMKELQDNVYIDSLVNVTLFDELRTELTILLNNTITDFTSRLDNCDSQLTDIVREVEEDYYKKDSVNAMVNIKVTTGEARENTDVRPINYREFDTETKQLFTGGSVSVVGEKAVGTENVKDLAITSNLRTALGSYALISCSSPDPIIVHIGLKKLIFPSGNNNLLLNNTTIYKIPSDYEVDLSGNGYSCSLYYDTIEQEFKYYEDGSANENCVYLGTIWWGTEGYKNSIFNFDYVLKDNYNNVMMKANGKLQMKNIFPSGKEVELFTKKPVNIDLENKKLKVYASGYCSILVNNYLKVLSTTDIELDLSINEYHVHILYDLDNNNLIASNLNSNENYNTRRLYNLGVIDLKNPFNSTIRCNFTVNGLSYENVLSSQFNKRWSGKKVNCLGDSITYGAGGKSWTYFIGDLIGASEVRNYGVSGSSIQDDGRNQGFINRYSNMDNDADLIIVWGGVNDHHWRTSSDYSFGDMNSTSNKTFYGALKNLCVGLKEKYKGKSILFITPMKNKGYMSGSIECPAWNVKNALGKTLTDYRNAILEVCDYYSIPVLDLYSSSGFTTGLIATETGLLFPDKLHPNEKMNKEILTPKIASACNNM